MIDILSYIGAIFLLPPAKKFQNINLTSAKTGRGVFHGKEPI